MAEELVDYRREVRDTIFKSSFTGVCATALAVTIFSPAGLGGVIGTSVASSFGMDSSSTSSVEDPYASLPSFPALLTENELSSIQSRLARAEASLEITRAATDAKVERIRSIALTVNTVAIAPTVASEPELRLTLSEPVAVVTTAPVEITMTPASYRPVAYADPHLELADLLLSRQNF